MKRVIVITNGDENDDMEIATDKSVNEIAVHLIDSGYANKIMKATSPWAKPTKQVNK